MPMLGRGGGVTYHQALITVEADEGPMHGTVPCVCTRLTDALQLLAHINTKNTKVSDAAVILYINLD